MCVCLHAYKHACKYRAEEVFGVVEELFFYLLSMFPFLFITELDFNVNQIIFILGSFCLFQSYFKDITLSFRKKQLQQ